LSGGVFGVARVSNAAGSETAPPRVVPAVAAALAIAVALAGCGGQRAPEPAVTIPAEESPVAERSALDVVNAVAPEWMTWEGVTMVYVGATEDGREAIKVGVVRRPHPVEDRIPAEVGGYPVLVTETGEIRPLGE